MKKKMFVIRNLLAFFVWVVILACGSENTTEYGGNQTSDKPFKKLLSSQTENICDWISPEKIQTHFKLSDAKYDPPQIAGGLSFQCTQRAAKDGYGVLITFHLRPFEDKETYEASLEASQFVAQHQKMKTLPIGKFATINHSNVPGTELISSILQIHGSSYTLELTSQYRGIMKESEVEKALVSIANAYVEKNP